MKICPRLGILAIVCGVMMTASSAPVLGQNNIQVGIELASERLPEAPVPQIEVAQGQGQSTSAAQSDEQKTDSQRAAEQIKAQEQQRVLGVVPTFNITYLGDSTVSMTAKQKFGLAFRSMTDPVAFVTPFLVAAYHEVGDDNEGFPWGAKGLGERAGAAYLDSFDGTMLGNALLPSLLHQDPRYFRKGYGSTGGRLMYAAATSFITKHDKTGKWEPNYSNIGGNIAAGAISTLYYPSSNSGVGLTISNGFIVTAEGALGAVFDEFWPDVSRKFLHKDPTHGLDAQRKAARTSKNDGEMAK